MAKKEVVELPQDRKLRRILEKNQKRVNKEREAYFKSVEAPLKAAHMKPILEAITDLHNKGGRIDPILIALLDVLANSSASKDGNDGNPGKDGKDGKQGKDGKDGNPGKDGKDGKQGKDGKDKK